MESELKLPLTNIQMELLKLYSVGVDDKTLIELKKEMGYFFLKKLRNQTDLLWEEKGYSDSYFKNFEDE